VRSSNASSSDGRPVHDHRRSAQPGRVNTRSPLVEDALKFRHIHELIVEEPATQWVPGVLKVYLIVRTRGGIEARQIKPAEEPRGPTAGCVHHTSTDDLKAAHQDRMGSAWAAGGEASAASSTSQQRFFSWKSPYSRSMAEERRRLAAGWVGRNGLPLHAQEAAADGLSSSPLRAHPDQSDRSGFARRTRASRMQRLRLRLRAGLSTVVLHQ